MLLKTAVFQAYTRYIFGVITERAGLGIVSAMELYTLRESG